MITWLHRRTTELLKCLEDITVCKQSLKNHQEKNIIFVHCYAHTLNLVLGDTASASLDVAKLFENLGAFYVMVSKSQPIHQLFEDCQKEMQLPIQSLLKLINTVRWSANEYCLDMFLKRYDSVMLMLEKITGSTAFDADRRSTADGM